MLPQSPVVISNRTASSPRTTGPAGLHSKSTSKHLQIRRGPQWDQIRSETKGTDIDGEVMWVQQRGKINIGLSEVRAAAPAVTCTVLIDVDSRSCVDNI